MNGLGMLIIAVAAGFVTLALVCAISGRIIAQGLRERRRDAQVLELLATFGPVVERARTAPQTLLTWFPIAVTARRAFPDAFDTLDGDAAHRFPFSSAQLESAHATWTTEWLAWEGAHDADYRRRSEVMEATAATGADGDATRSGLELLERERLETYQRRYETYVKVSKALAALTDPPAGG